MTKLEMVQSAVAALGEVPAEALAAFVEERYRVQIPAKFVPVYVATVQDRIRLAANREAARKILQEAALAAAQEQAAAPTA